ncbi:hypothetical protein KEM56_002063, partial [Ascosphaera pollenicola]
AAKKKSQDSASSKEAAADSNPDHLGAATESTEDQANERDESDVKLLRLRGKVHEIIIIPDRKYLLCVVQDLTFGQTGHTSTAR